MKTQPKLPRRKALLEMRLTIQRTRKADSITKHFANFVTLASQEVERVTG